MSEFNLTEDQASAMKMMERFMRSAPPMPAVLTGYAGTGKTTLIKVICSLYGTPIVLAPTGKAALRVREATGFPASTIHRWMYKPNEDQDTGETQFSRKGSGEVDIPENSLVIVDESSMVGRDLWEDLWDMCQILNLRVLLVGDPFQLSPVENSKEEGFKSFSPLTEIETQYRAQLTQITRQALDNPILRASMMIRDSNRIDVPLRLLNRVFTRNFDDKALEVYKAGGVVIVHKNVTRHRVNAALRASLGYGEELVPGEPLSIIRNNYDLNKFNGEITTFDGWEKFDDTVTAVKNRYKNISMMARFGWARAEDNEVMLSPEQIFGKAAEIGDTILEKVSHRYYADSYHDDAKGECYTGGGKWKKYTGPPHLHANFGYCTTAHRAQGSEWNDVLILIESSVRSATYEGRRWLYTALTRSKKNLYFAMETSS